MEQARRDKLAFFEHHCSEVADGLMVAGNSVAADLAILQRSRVSHILNCVGALLPCHFPNDFTYKVLYLQGEASILQLVFCALQKAASDRTPIALLGIQSICIRAWPFACSLLAGFRLAHAWQKWICLCLASYKYAYTQRCLVHILVCGQSCAYHHDGGAAQAFMNMLPAQKFILVADTALCMQMPQARI